MNVFRRVMLGVSAASFAVCCLFLNVMGGIALMMNNYTNAGTYLLISSVLLAIALTAAFFRKGIMNIISVVFNAAGTVFYILPIGILNAIPDAQVPRESVEILTSRIYPAVIVTISLAVVIFADFFSADRIAARAERKKRIDNERNRALNGDEKII